MSLTTRIQAIRFDLCWLRNRPKSPYLMVIGLVFTCALVGSYIHYIPKIEAQVKNRPEFQIGPSQLIIRELPEWITPFTTEITPINFTTTTIFTPQLAHKISLSYAQNPWVKEVREVILRYPNYARAKMILRRPYVLVESDGYCHLCDTQGVRLPLQWENKDAPTSFPVIQNITTALPIPGQRWEDQTLSQAIEILLLLESHPNLGIEMIWLKPVPTEKIPSIVLVSKQRWWLIWGTTLSSEIPAVTTKQRLAALDAYLADNEISSKTVREIDVRFGMAIVREKTPLFPELVQHFSRK